MTNEDVSRKPMSLENLPTFEDSITPEFLSDLENVESATELQAVFNKFLKNPDGKVRVVGDKTLHYVIACCEAGLNMVKEGYDVRETFYVMRYEITRAIRDVLTRRASTN